MKTFVVLALLVAVCASSTSALRCYSCLFPGEPKCEDVNGLSGEDCGEPSAIEKLASLRPVCLKGVIDVKGAKQITRSCSKQGGDTNACTLFGKNVEHCSVCETDLCNKSTFVLASVWSVAIPVAVVMIFTKFF